MYYSNQYDKIQSNVSVPIQVPSSGNRERQRETIEHRNIRVTVECPAAVTPSGPPTLPNFKVNERVNWTNVCDMALDYGTKGTHAMQSK